MGFPIGLPSEEQPDGTWVGMTPEGIQRVLGNMYDTSGVLPGNRAETKVSGTSSWAYEIPSLAAFMWVSYADRKGLLVPVEAETIPVSAPVGGAARTDVIYVDSTGVVQVAEGRSSAPSGVTIDRMAIPAGASNTRGATSTWDTDYAIPAGASLGRLAHWADPGGGAAGTDRVTRHTQRFHVPSDRLLRVDVTSTIKSAVSSGRGGMGVILEIDGTWVRAMSCAYDDAWRTYGASWVAEVAEGAHTVEVITQWNTGDTYQLATGQSRTEVSVWDMGVAE